jgi:hypothetical protein
LIQPDFIHSPDHRRTLEFSYPMKASGLWLSHKTQKADAAPAVVDPA